MTKKQLLYPVFLECCIYIKDPSWKNVFEDFAYGICPYECFISKGYLCCNSKNKNFIYNIKSKKEPKLIFEEIKKLLIEKLNILNKTCYKNIYDESEEDKIIKWSKIKRKNIKDFLILNYLTENKINFNLSNHEVNKLQKIINIGIIFKTILSDDIIIKENKIHKIQGIDMVQERVIYEKDFTNVEIPFFSPEITCKKSFVDLYFQKNKDLNYNNENEIDLDIEDDDCAD